MYDHSYLFGILRFGKHDMILVAIEIPFDRGKYYVECNELQSVESHFHFCLDAEHEVTAIFEPGLEL